MNDVVDLLRHCEMDSDSTGYVMLNAAKEIERLEAEIERLRNQSRLAGAVHLEAGDS